jgi:hypothetical protein
MKAAPIASLAMLFLSVVLATFSCGQLLVACKGAEAPSPAVLEAGVAEAPGVCTLIENITGTQANPIVESLCANAGEIATIVATVIPLIALADRTDAGKSRAACRLIPTTTVCATPEQLHAGIQAVVSQRRTRFLVDAGMQ